MQIAKRAAPALAVPEAQGPKRAKASTPANGVASNSKTPQQCSNKRGLHTNEEVSAATLIASLVLLMLPEVLLLPSTVSQQHIRSVVVIFHLVLRELLATYLDSLFSGHKCGLECSQVFLSMYVGIVDKSTCH